jgi:hypothetical protein
MMYQNHQRIISIAEQSVRLIRGSRLWTNPWTAAMFAWVILASFGDSALISQDKPSLPAEAVSAWAEAEESFMNADGSWFIRQSTEVIGENSPRPPDDYWVKKRNGMIVLENRDPRSPKKISYVNGDGISFCANEKEANGAWVLRTAQTGSFDGQEGYDPWYVTKIYLGRGFSTASKRLDRFLQDAMFFEILDSPDHPDQKIFRYEAESRVGPQQVRKVTKGSFFVEPQNRWRVVRHDSISKIEGMDSQGLARETLEYDDQGIVEKCRKEYFFDERGERLRSTTLVSVERLDGIPSASEFTLRHYGIEAKRSRGFWSRPAIWLAAVGVIAIALAIVVRRKRQFST